MKRHKYQKRARKITKNADVIGAGSIMLGFFLAYSAIPFGVFLLPVGFFVLSAASLYKSGLVYKGVRDVERILLTVVFICACVGMVASLFKIMHWPIADLMFFSFFGSIAIVTMASVQQGKNTLKIVPFNELLKLAGAFLVYFVL